MQSLSDYKPMGVFYVLRLILFEVSTWEREGRIQREGINSRYNMTSKSDKKKARANPSTYKAPESAARLHIGAKSRLFASIDDLPITPQKITKAEQALLPIDFQAPVQLSNPEAYLCYANTIAQCAYSNQPIANALLSDVEFSAETGKGSQQLEHFHFFSGLMRRMTSRSQFSRHNDTSYSVIYPVELAHCARLRDDLFPVEAARQIHANENPLIFLGGCCNHCVSQVMRLTRFYLKCVQWVELLQSIGVRDVVCWLERRQTLVFTR